MNTPTNALVIMACSATKLNRAAPALDLYRGVLFGSYRANVHVTAQPHVVILSALHGFIPSDKVIEPYEQRMTVDRADSMIADLAGPLPGAWPEGAAKVMLAGGKEYRRVMRAAIPHLIAVGAVKQAAQIIETSGGIGFQRQQLGEFVRGLKEMPQIVGHQPNGTALYRRLGEFEVDQPVFVAYRARPDKAARPAVVEELFEGPVGPTASVVMLDATNPDCARTWVGLRDLQPRRDSLF